MIFWVLPFMSKTEKKSTQQDSIHALTWSSVLFKAWVLE